MQTSPTNASYFLTNNRLNNRDFNIDQNNQDYDFFPNGAALQPGNTRVKQGYGVSGGCVGCRENSTVTYSNESMRGAAALCLTTIMGLKKRSDCSRL